MTLTSRIGSGMSITGRIMHNERSFPPPFCPSPNERPTTLTAAFTTRSEADEILGDVYSIGDLLEYRTLGAGRISLTAEIHMPFARAMIALLAALKPHANGVHVVTHGGNDEE